MDRDQIDAVPPPRQASVDHQHIPLLGTSPGVADIDRTIAYRPEDCSWSDVLAAMEEATEFDRTTRKGPKRIYKNKALLITLESLSDTIPDQYGLSVLRGGLKTVFKVGQSALPVFYALYYKVQKTQKLPSVLILLPRCC